MFANLNKTQSFVIHMLLLAGTAEVERVFTAHTLDASLPGWTFTKMEDFKDRIPNFSSTDWNGTGVVLLNNKRKISYSFFVYMYMTVFNKNGLFNIFI